jgi:soluble lytic murein transglycosylase
MQRPLTSFRLVLISLLACPQAGAQGFDLQGELTRVEFRAAYASARAGILPLAPDRAGLSDYVLYPYLEAARLGAAVAAEAGSWSEADVAARDFLAAHEGEPVAVNLRLVWLDSLAARALWPELIRHFRRDLAATRLRCLELRAHIATGEVGAIAPRIVEEWLTPAQLPLECEPVFQWLRDAGALDDELTAARVELLLENERVDFARVIARRLPAADAEPLLAWADLIERPRAALEAWLATAATAATREALLHGWSRLARDEPDAALALHDRLIATVGADDASRFSLALALGLAWDRRPESLALFGQVAAADLDDYALGWLTRAALWADEPDMARAAIERMSAAAQDSSAWRYWAGRLAPDRAGRETQFGPLLPRDNYYSAVAAAGSRDRVELHPEPVERDLPALARVSAQPALQRAGELRLIDLPIAATREWQYAAARFSPQERRQSVHHAVALEWFDLAITTATELEIFYDYELLYPRPWPDLVAAAAREFDVPPALIFAVIRQESLYRADVESSAGALGLMQLTRGTAADVARELGQAVPGTRELLDPAINIRFGTARLATLIERFDGNPVVALAAYNAGPAAAARWLPAAPVDGDIWLENVPFNETRDYVRRVLWHSTVFAWLDGERTDAGDWLRPVRPPD